MQDTSNIPILYMMN